MIMKKFFSHPLFYYIFAVLGLCGMILQASFLRSAEDVDDEVVGLLEAAWALIGPGRRNV